MLVCSLVQHRSITHQLIADPDGSQSLSLALQGQELALYGKINREAVLRYGLYGLSTRHSDLLHYDRVSVPHHGRSHFQMEFQGSLENKECSVVTAA